MRYMGIDYGTKRVGIALSTEEGKMAFPYDTFDNDTSLFARIEALIEERQVGGIVVGKSVRLTGDDNAIQKKIDAFVGELTLHTGLSVQFEDEQYTTQESLRYQKRSQKTDSSAAAIILNSYLSRHTNAL